MNASVSVSVSVSASASASPSVNVSVSASMCRVIQSFMDSDSICNFHEVVTHDEHASDIVGNGASFGKRGSVWTPISNQPLPPPPPLPYCT